MSNKPPPSVMSEDEGTGGTRTPCRSFSILAEQWLTNYTQFVPVDRDANFSPLDNYLQLSAISAGLYHWH